MEFFLIKLTNMTINLIFLFIFFLLLGIAARSILLNLKSLKFPRAFPIDIMHLFFENISINMFKHWSGMFFKNSNNEGYIISNTIWKAIGKTIKESRRDIPLEFGRPPHDIYKHFSGFKAKEWSDWITIYSMPMLKNKLPNM
jgi:hypothetical protein